jgi:hypothetical protein
MSAPRRWADSPDAPEDVKDLFAAGLPTRGMSPETRARLSRRLAQPLAAGVVASYLAAWKSVAVAAGIGLTATTAAVVAVRAARVPDVVTDAPSTSPSLGAPSKRAPAVGVERGAGVESPVPPAPPAPPAVAPSPAAAPAASNPAEIPHARVSVGTAAAPSPASSPVVPVVPAEAVAPSIAADTLAAELALIQQARARYASDPEGTLDRLDEHARRFPEGKLSLERELLALDALKRLGRVDDERARAERLLPVVRGTIYENRVRTHLGAEPGTR